MSFPLSLFATREQESEHNNRYQYISKTSPKEDLSPLSFAQIDDSKSSLAETPEKRRPTRNQLPTKTENPPRRVSCGGI